MTPAAPSTEPATAPGPSSRSHARAAGLLYLLTFVSSIPALVLIAPVLHDARYVAGDGSDTRVLWGCLLDTVNALASVGSAVALFPVVRRHNESLALGLVASRMLEAAVIMIGVVSLLAVVTMRRDGTGADDTSQLTTAAGLVALRDQTFLLGPGLMPAVNAILLGTLLHRSRLVPRVIPVVGLVGAPLLLVAFVSAYFGATDQVGTLSGVLTLPVAAWELALGVWLTVRGFDPAAVSALGVPTPAPAGRGS